MPMGQSSPQMRLGQAVRKAREELGFSQEELAEKCGLHRTYVGSVERGERNVSIVNIVKLAWGLGVEGSELLGRAGL